MFLSLLIGASRNVTSDRLSVSPYPQDAEHLLEVTFDKLSINWNNWRPMAAARDSFRQFRQSRNSNPQLSRHTAPAFLISKVIWLHLKVKEVNSWKVLGDPARWPPNEFVLYGNPLKSGIPDALSGAPSIITSSRGRCNPILQPHVAHLNIFNKTKTVKQLHIQAREKENKIHNHWLLVFLAEFFHHNSLQLLKFSLHNLQLFRAE